MNFYMIKKCLHVRNINFMALPCQSNGKLAVMSRGLAIFAKTGNPQISCASLHDQLIYKNNFIGILSFDSTNKILTGTINPVHVKIFESSTVISLNTLIAEPRMSPSSCKRKHKQVV